MSNTLHISSTNQIYYTYINAKNDCVVLETNNNLKICRFVEDFHYKIITTFSLFKWDNNLL